MKVRVLGSGTVDPHPQRASSGYLVSHRGSSVLIDCGTGVLRNGVRFGETMSSVSHLLLTHLHPDHTVDLVPLLFARKYAPGGWQNRPPLTLYGPPELSTFLRGIYQAWPSVEPPADHQVSVVTVEPGVEFSPLSGLRVLPFAVEHGDMTAFAYRVQSESGTVCFSGDTRLCEGVRRAAEEADLFFCECSCFPRGCPPLGCREVHLSWEDVADICKEARPSRLVLTHLYQVVLESDPLGSLREALEIPVELASDGAVFEV